ncbi:MAG: sialidase family protein [Mycobacteriales bacterium]
MAKRHRALFVFAAALLLTGQSRMPYGDAVGTARNNDVGAHSHAAVDLEAVGGSFSAARALVAQQTRDPKGRSGSNRPLVAYHAGGRKIAGKKAGSTRLFRTGAIGLEPTLGIDRSGNIYTNVFPEVVVTGAGVATTVYRTRDGARFDDVGPKVAGTSSHQYTEDPYLFVDPDTGRVFHNDLIFPCQQTTTSDDRGESWSEAVANCDQADHQTLFAGPPPAGGVTPIGYRNVVYDCAANGGALAGPSSTTTSCDKSLDGGRTFVPTGSPPYMVDPVRYQEAFCDGVTGHGVVGDDGTVYLPRGHCGQPFVAISRDEGATWQRVQVAANGIDSGGSGVGPQVDADHEAAISVDARGNLYYLWVAHDYKPYLAVSRDHGAHWSRPLMVAPPGVRESALPSIAVAPHAQPGHVALAFMGATDTPAKPYPRDDGHYGRVTWNGYIVETVDALAKNPTFYGAPINDPLDPLVKGMCAPVRCQAEYDFIDVQVSRAGQPWAVFIDACLGEKCGALGESVVATVSGGLKLT